MCYLSDCLLFRIIKIYQIFARDNIRLIKIEQHKHMSIEMNMKNVSVATLVTPVSRTVFSNLFINDGNVREENLKLH